MKPSVSADIRRRMDVAVAAGDYTTVAALARSLADEAATAAPAEKGKLSQALVALAARAERAGQATSARACIDVALALRPEDAETHAKKWALCLRSGDCYGVEAADAALHRLTLARVARHPLAATGLRFFNPNLMITRIGELAQQLDTVVKAQRLGWLPPMHCVLLAPPQRVVNAALLDYWRTSVPVVSDPVLIRSLTPLARHLDFDPLRIAVPGHRVLHKSHAHKLVQRGWEERGHPPLLQLTEAHRQEGWRRIRALGPKDGEWFACLHVREAGYLHEERNDPDHPHRMRNADVSSYLPAVRAIVERGGWVVRVGDPSMTPLPEMERVVDYALSDIRSDRMDVFLCASCRFFLGTSSGPAIAAMVFGVPTVMSNMTPMSHTASAAQDIFLPKLLRDRRDGRLLTMAESLRPPFRDLLRGDRLRALGFDVVDNTVEDLADAVVEMMDRLDGRSVYDAEDDDLQAALVALYASTDNIIQGRMARGFLRRNRRLMALP